MHTLTLTIEHDSDTNKYTYAIYDCFPEHILDTAPLDCGVSPLSMTEVLEEATSRAQLLISVSTNEKRT
jgi:hypothetical protein